MKSWNWRDLLEKGYLKPVGPTLIVTVLGWSLYQVHVTATTLRSIGKINPIRARLSYIHVDSSISKDLTLGREGYLEGGRLTQWLHCFRYKLALRLLHIARSAEPLVRTFAVQKLANTTHLSEADVLQLTQACDAHTAVGLARYPRSHWKFFLPTPLLYRVTDEAILIYGIKDVLYKLNEKYGHFCVKYFLCKAFPDFKVPNNYLFGMEIILTQPWSVLISQDNILLLCIQALDHHIAIVKDEKLLVRLGGLPLLMAIYQHLNGNINVEKMICRVLIRICLHPEFLPEVFSSGWIGVLAKWLECEDQELRVMAAHCLANLDRDEITHAHYGKHVIPLYPRHRSLPPLIDVVFVHGLLGGVFSTWRQRESSEFLCLQDDDLEMDKQRQKLQHHSSNYNTEKYLRVMSEKALAEWDQLGADYEFVVDDFPASCMLEEDQYQYIYSGQDKKIREFATDHSMTLCWPMNWLPQDCPSIRVLGIDYESSISEWFPSCSEKMRMKSLEERSAVVLKELRRCGVGQRPIVWVAHSMGGLLVKKVLTQAMNSSDDEARHIAQNSKAIVFLSTPHLGCPLAELNEILKYVFWPSTEVEELRRNSFILNKLHDQFQYFLDSYDTKIVTFAECKCTKISNLGIDVHIVPPEFSYIGAGDSFEMLCDHICIAKPCTRLSFIYQTILNLIKEVQDSTLNK